LIHILNAYLQLGHAIGNSEGKRRIIESRFAVVLSDKGVAVGCIGNLPAGSAATAAGEALVTCAVAEVPGCQGK